MTELKFLFSNTNSINAKDLISLLGNSEEKENNTSDAKSNLDVNESDDIEHREKCKASITNLFFLILADRPLIFSKQAQFKDLLHNKTFNTPKEVLELTKGKATTYHAYALLYDEDSSAKSIVDEYTTNFGLSHVVYADQHTNVCQCEIFYLVNEFIDCAESACLSAETISPQIAELTANIAKRKMANRLYRGGSFKDIEKYAPASILIELLKDYKERHDMI